MHPWRPRASSRGSLAGDHVAHKEGGSSSRNGRDGVGKRLVMDAWLLPESDGCSTNVTADQE